VIFLCVFVCSLVLEREGAWKRVGEVECWEPLVRPGAAHARNISPVIFGPAICHIPREGKRVLFLLSR
jgi:hypothetical protein